MLDCATVFNAMIFASGEQRLASRNGWLASRRSTIDFLMSCGFYFGPQVEQSAACNQGAA